MPGGYSILPVKKEYCSNIPGKHPFQAPAQLPIMASKINRTAQLQNSFQQHYSHLSLPLSIFCLQIFLTISPDGGTNCQLSVNRMELFYQDGLPCATSCFKVAWNKRLVYNTVITRFSAASQTKNQPMASGNH